MKNRTTITKQKKLALLFLLCSTYFPLHAEEAEVITKLEAVTSYGEQTALQQRKQSPNSVVVVDQEQIERFNDITAGDVLRRLPGVLFGGAPGESKDVRIRGLDKEYSQVLINGRRIPGGGEKREFQLDKLPAQLIERVEVIRSPSADMDAQGIAGTINIVLKSSPKMPLFTMTAGIGQLKGEDSKPNFNIAYGAQTGDLGYLLNMNVQQRQLLKDKTKQSFKADGSADKLETENEDKQFDELHFAPSFDWALSKYDQLIIEPLLLVSDEDKTKDKQKFKGDGSIDGRELELEEKQRSNRGLFGQWLHQYGSGNEFSLALNVQESKEEKNKVKTAYKGEDNLDKIENEIEDKSDKEWALTLKNKSFVGENHTLVTGIEIINKDRNKIKTKTETKKGKTKEKSEGKDKYSIKEQRVNFYILDEYSLSERQLLTPGIRLEWTDTDVSGSTGTTSSSTDSFWSPSLHYLFNWTQATNIRASITNTKRRPKFDDLAPYVDSKDGTLNDPDKAGNPDLLPETATGFDVGIEHYFAKQSGSIGLNVFYRDISDKIESRINYNSVNERYEVSSINVGEAVLKGIELDANIDMTTFGVNGLTLSSNVTFLDGDITDQVTGNKSPFKEQADYVYNIGFDHRLPAVDVSWGMNFNQISAREGEEVKDGKQTLETAEIEKYLDLYIKKSFVNGTEIRFSVQNILETDSEKNKTIFKDDGSVDKFEDEFEKSNRAIYLSFTGRW